MTPEQKLALEQVAGRTLTDPEITAIDLLLPARQDAQIAEILSTNRFKLVETYVDEGKIISTIAAIDGDVVGLTAGNALLDELTTNPIYRHVKAKLFRVGLDVSQPTTRNALDNFVTYVTGIKQEYADAIKNLARRDDPINFNRVSDALNVAEGRTTLENF